MDKVVFFFNVILSREKQRSKKIVNPPFKWGLLLRHTSDNIVVMTGRKTATTSFPNSNNTKRKPGFTIFYLRGQL